MNFDHVFAAAYIDNNTTHRILGVKLRPFCLWHVMLLQVLNSPFVSKGPITPHDLKTALGICRLKYRESKVRRPLLPILTQKRMERATAQFLEYVGDYLSKPEYNVIPFEPTPGSKPPRHLTPPPDIVCAAFDAAQGARVSIDVAWNMPIGEAYIAQVIYYRNQGAQIDFMSDEERLFQRELKEAGIK